MDPTNYVVLNEAQPQALRMLIINQYAGHPGRYFAIIVEEARIRAHQEGQKGPRKINICDVQWEMHNGQKHLVQKQFKNILKELQLSAQQLLDMGVRWGNAYAEGQALMIYND